MSRPSEHSLQTKRVPRSKAKGAAGAGAEKPAPAAARRRSRKRSVEALGGLVAFVLGLRDGSVAALPVFEGHGDRAAFLKADIDFVEGHTAELLSVSRDPAGARRRAQAVQSHYRGVLEREERAGVPVLVFVPVETEEIGEAAPWAYHTLLTLGQHAEGEGEPQQRHRDRLVCIPDKSRDMPTWMRDARSNKAVVVKGDLVVKAKGLEELVLPKCSPHPLTLQAERTHHKALDQAWERQADERAELLKALAQIPLLNDESPERQRQHAKTLTRWMAALNCHLKCPRDGVRSVPVYQPTMGRIVIQHALQSDASTHKVVWHEGLELIPRRKASVFDSSPPSA